MIARRTPTAVALAPILFLLGVTSAWASDEDVEADSVSAVVVTAPRDTAYRADRTITATRTDTPLRDVPQAEIGRAHV